MKITIFGGAATQPGEPAYKDAYRLGYLLGQKGHTILTGGYMGAMEAASRGAAEGGGHVIGVTCDEIEAYRPCQPNPWVKEERRFTTLRARLYALIDGCDAAIALPGGVGTLSEIAAMWNELIISTNNDQRKMVLIGAGWHETMNGFISAQGDFIPQSCRDKLLYASSVEDAVQKITVQ